MARLPHDRKASQWLTLLATVLPGIPSFIMASAPFRLMRHFDVPPMNNHQRKTLTAIFSKPPPATIAWSEVESLIRALGGKITHGQGSKVRIDLHEISLSIHSPHPQQEVKHYAVRLLREFLQKAGVEP